MAGYQMQKEDILKRLGRVEGQVRGISRMIEDDRYCIDVLDQVAAVTRALQQVSIGLMHDHLSHCLVEAVANGGDEATSKIDEATAAIARLVKS
ncbi:metal-sensitive transcriptional regulator [Aquihabitans sp. G128]|uniref:metal-sensitive transcriptional regulator n=1 Tax=Aquihabitans sp. G128 TaxID=2849779 RepID=UPI002739B8B9|nr:metal-sensitive transcriptional regulator [Aquihabitans sp. G128]